MQWPYHAHCSISKVKNFFFVHECFCTPVCWKAGAMEIPTFNQVQSLGLQKCVVINWNILSKFKLIYSFSCSHKIPIEWKLQLLFSRFSPNWPANSKVLDTSAGTTELNHFCMNSNSTAIKDIKILSEFSKSSENIPKNIFCFRISSLPSFLPK